MIRGLYTAATGMTVQRNKMDVVTNNIANVETSGFKKDTLVSSAFDKVMLQRINDDPNLMVVGPYSFGAHVQQVVTDFGAGSLESTGVPTDLALEGDAFFAVETPAGERYTRAGNFSVNAEGYLVTVDGNYVRSETGRVFVGTDEFGVATDGTVTAGGTPIGRLRIVSFADNTTLRKQGDNLYTGTPAAQTNAFAVRQGFQEASNVNAADEMVNMMTIYRKYEADQKILTMTDETLGMAVNKLGRLGG